MRQKKGHTGLRHCGWWSRSMMTTMMGESKEISGEGDGVISIQPMEKE